MTPSTRPPVPRESEVQRSILATLAYLGVDCWRQNVGSFPIGAGPGRRYVKAGARGQADILGILPGGRFLAVEVKRPGNRPSPDQLAFLRRVNASGGVAFWATSQAEVYRVITALLANPSLRVEVGPDGEQILTDEEMR